MHRDQLRIADPCHEDWGAMTGDRRRRHCASCDKHVHDLSAMTEGQARELVASSSDLCVRYAVRSDGSVLHASPAGRLPRLLAVAGALLSAAPALASSAPAPVEPAPEGPSLMARAITRIRQAIGAEDTVSQGQVEIVMGDVAEPAPPPEPPPPPPPMFMGRIAAPPTIVLPPSAEPEPPPVALPPIPGSEVIPEVEETLRTR